MGSSESDKDENIDEYESIAGNRDSGVEAQGNDSEDGDEREGNDPHLNDDKSSEVDITILHLSLNLYTQDSPTSRFTLSSATPHSTPNAPFLVIGRGTCGTVFEIQGTEFALKKGSSKMAIWGDSQMTNTACKAVVECKSLLEFHFPQLSVPRVPRVKDWARDEDMDSWWDLHGHRFTKAQDYDDDDKRGHVFCVQRILPLPKSTREALVRKYFPAEDVALAVVEPENRDCLVRPYLGKCRSIRDVERPPLTLENYPLFLDQLIDIDVDVGQYAQEMALGLAVMHWRARLDGMDMEFVISSATSEGELPSVVPDWRTSEAFVAASEDFKRRVTHLWVVDFDKAETIDLLVQPGDTEQTIWNTFEEAYIKAAEIILDMDFRLGKHQRKALQRYPKQFVQEWKKTAQEQMDTEDGGFIQFA
ncbi:hypothetical protein EKO04_009323 [Ascochyta lentis]|uniref:DUF3669 domain-containing protein n=1 Tax=Ascochyta lentis TaxID=205686 RepID=A0A8H7IWV4_9PLEO|nr:hypothetical protein EKO04_009323 [Ascochyta lentis]